MGDSKPTLDVRHNETASRFETTVDGLLSVASYHLDGNVMRMYHTEVPAALEGRGIAGQLVRAAFAHATANALSIDPRCSYVRAYMQRHPETHVLLAAGARL